MKMWTRFFSTLVSSFVFVSFILVLVTHAKTTPTKPTEMPTYTAGTGGQYLMINGADKNEMSIVFIESTKAHLVIEVHMKSLTDNATAQVEMAQQYVFKMVGGTLQLTKGIIKIPQIDKPQIIPTEALQGLGGVQMKSFLIGSTKDLDGLKVGEMTITENNKSFKATQYKKSENGQTLNYWISDEAKPLGLVKMVSQGSGANSNYTLSYRGELNSVAAKIDASQAVPMNEAAQMWLPLLSGGLKNK